MDPVYNICKRILNQNLITFIVLSVSFNQKNPPGYYKVSEELNHEFVFEWVDTVYMCKQIIGKFDFQFPVGNRFIFQFPVGLIRARNNGGSKNNVCTDWGFDWSTFHLASQFDWSHSIMLKMK